MISEITRQKMRVAKLGKPRAGNPLNWKHSEESKEKNRNSHLGKVAWNKGLTAEQDSRVNYKRPTAFKKGKKPWNTGLHPEYMQGKNHPMFGKHHTDETRQKISQRRKGISTGKGRKHSEETRKIISLKVMGKNKGEKNCNWKGGITSVNEKIRKSIEYSEWRAAVFKRDDYTCQECKLKGGILNADHIKPFSLYPDLRLVVDNGRTLCKGCHLRIGWSLFKQNNPNKK